VDEITRGMYVTPELETAEALRSEGAELIRTFLYEQVPLATVL